MKWTARTAAEQNSTGRRIWRRVRGFFNFVSLAPIVYLLLFLAVLGLTGYALVKDPTARNSPVTILSTAIGVIGLAITIAQAYRQRRIRS